MVSIANRIESKVLVKYKPVKTIDTTQDQTNPDMIYSILESPCCAVLTSMVDRIVKHLI